MNVHLRHRKQNANGKISLYLEFYKGKVTLPNGKIKYIRDYEFLNLFLTDKPKTAIDKQQNKEMLELANVIKAQRELEIKNGQFGFHQKNKNTNFISYFQKLAEKKDEKHENAWRRAVRCLVRFAGENLTFNEITEKFCENYKNWLETTTSSKGTLLSSSTGNLYFQRLKSCLNQAIKDNLIQSNPCINIKSIKVIEREREFLTMEELKVLSNTECKNNELKRAFLFSCLTGLRISDIHKLVWSEVQENQEQWRIVFRQQKTKNMNYVEIPQQAMEYMGERGNPDERVFTGWHSGGVIGTVLENWMLKAGITKKITFHCARHTYAVLLLTYGSDLYTVQKLLGHTNIKTTQIYAKIIDEKRVAAVNNIPSIK